MQVLPRVVGAPPIMHSMERLSLVEYIPELSLLIVGSQGACSALLISVVRDAVTGLLELRPRQQIPQSVFLSPLAGLAVQRDRSFTEPTWSVILLFHFGRAMIYRVTAAAAANGGGPIASTSLKAQ